MTNLPKFSTALLHPRYWLPWFMGFLYMVRLFRLGNGTLRLGDEPNPGCARFGV